MTRPGKAVSEPTPSDLAPSAPVQAGNGLKLILGATVVAGAAGYVVTIMVPAVLGPNQVQPFLLFWSAMYLMVAVLAGVQQEVTRAARPVTESITVGRRTVRRFTVVVSALVGALVVAAIPLWNLLFTPEMGWRFALPLALAAASYVVVATLSGLMYGLVRWQSIALFIAGDAVLRLACIGAVLLVTQDVVTLAWAAALPFALSIVLFWPLVRRGVVGRFDIDVTNRQLGWNISRTLVASLSMGVLMSGFPLVIGATSTGLPAGPVSVIIVLLTLVRAPVVIPMLSLQSFLIVHFRALRGAALGASILRIGALVVGGTAVLSVLAWWLGPWVVSIILPAYQTDAWVLAGIVASSGFLALLCVSGPAVLARSAHAAYSAGWVVAAAVSVALMFVPLDVEPRTLIALAVGPLVGFVVHIGSLVLADRAGHRPHPSGQSEA